MNINGMEITSNGSPEGNTFLEGMRESQLMAQMSQELFTRFIHSRGFTTWHIHNGWIDCDKEKKDPLNSDKIKIWWIDEHFGYAHYHRPMIGDSMIVMADSPSIERDKKPKTIYCYDVIGQDYKEYILKLKTIKQIIYKEGNYQLYKKPWWSL